MNTPLTTTAMQTTPVTTATPASVYQQLRGHLTELKLADAADALPSVLDQAPAEGRSLTHTLQRLPSIEVTATDARRLSGRFRFANLPTGATLDDFDLDAASGIDRSLLVELGICRYLETATRGEIHGDTTVAAAMLDRLLHRSVVVTLDGGSYRLRNHTAQSDELRPVTTCTNCH